MNNASRGQTHAMRVTSLLQGKQQETTLRGDMRRTELAQVMLWRERVPWNGTASRGHMAKRTILCRKCVKL